MQYRRFGKTNLPLSVFSLGTMRCLASATIACQTLEKALEMGINHLETAQGYGLSEVYLGQALRSLAVDRSQVYLTSKLPPLPSAAEMERAIDTSLDRLQVSYLDALAIHGLNTWEHLSLVTQPEGCMQAMRRAMEQGKVRHLGFSTHGSLELIEATIATQLFEFVNLHYTYFFQRHATAIDLASRQDMGIFIISPADKGGMLYTPPAQLELLCQPFSPLELSYRFLLSDPRITTLSLGPAHPDELTPALEIGDRTAPLTEREIEVFQRLEQHQTQVLATDQCRQCYACLPCPEAIHIPEVLRLRNLAVAYDMVAFGQYRYRMFENAGHWFPGTKANRCTDCGDCLPRCPEHLSIPALLRDAHDRLQGRAGRRLWGEGS